MNKEIVYNEFYFNKDTKEVTDNFRAMFPNSVVSFKYITPLFNRVGIVTWKDAYIETVLLNDGKLLTSKLLNRSEAKTLKHNEKYNFVYRIGCDSTWHIDDTPTESDLENYLVFISTNDKNEAKMLKLLIKRSENKNIN